MTEPLRMSFEVACPIDRAFTLWTAGIGSWWPADHTVTGRRDVSVVLEAGVGGRIFERTPEGVEHDWGEVTVWTPPTQLAYRWHLRQDRADATDVEIRFAATGAAATLVEIEHRGWERLGDRADPGREQNRAGWRSLLPHYRALVEGADAASASGPAARRR